MLVEVVAPYAHGAYTRAAKKIQRDALRKMLEITWDISKATIPSSYHQLVAIHWLPQRPFPTSIVYNVFNTIMASSFSE